MKKVIGDKRLIVLAALVFAMISAWGRGNELAFLGIGFYMICSVLVFKNHQRASLFLWFALGVHVILTGYSLWTWQRFGIVPCHYCLLAAGFVFLASMFWWKRSAALLPLLLMLMVWYNWDGLFYPPVPTVLQETAEGGENLDDQKPASDLKKSELEQKTEETPAPGSWAKETSNKTSAKIAESEKPGQGTEGSSADQTRQPAPKKESEKQTAKQTSVTAPQGSETSSPNKVDEVDNADKPAAPDTSAQVGAAPPTANESKDDLTAEFEELPAEVPKTASG